MTAWISNIILIILLATVFELLLPNSSFQKYVKIVVGLLLIVAILNPILKLFSMDFDKTLASIFQNDYLEEDKMKNLIENKKTIIQAGQQAYIVEQMAVQMENSVEEELIKKYHVQIEKLDIKANEQFNSENLEKYIDQISIKLTKASPNKTEENAIETVKKVEVNISDDFQKESKDQSSLEKEIQSFLAEKWQLSKDKVLVQMEGG